jgi:anti-sigma-K factor RskA
MRARLIRPAFLRRGAWQRAGSDLHALVGAYVLDALPAAERASFEHHLVSCEQCRDDTRALREATARLGATAAVPPRPELREQVVRSAGRTRQVPPTVPRQRDLGRTSGLAGRMAAGHRRLWLAVAAAVVVVALAVTSVGLGLHLSSMQHRLSAAEQRDSAIAAVLTAKDATTTTAHVRTGGVATVVMSHRAHALVFIAKGLPGLPPSKAYELWLMGPAGPTPAGMLPPPGHHGMSGPMVVGQIAPGDQLALMIVPASGSHNPTSAPIVLVALGS